MLVERFSASTASDGSYIYVSGGCHMSLILENVERFSIEKQEWEQLPSFDSGKFGHLMIAFPGRFLYAIGGANKVT